MTGEKKVCTVKEMNVLTIIQMLIKSGIIIGAVLIGINILLVGPLFRGWSSKLIGLGIILLALDSVDRVFEYFKWDLVMLFMPVIGEELFHDILRFSGLCLISLGLFRLSKKIFTVK